jgi:predicted ABC-type ATPase
VKDILLSEQKPVLIVIAGPMGAGKTTFYDAHLKEAFPTLVPPFPHQHEAMLREHRSFAVEDLVVDTEFLENARNAGYNTKVIFVSTEDPDLNVGRILIRMGHGGQSVPLAAIPESYGESMKSLRKARKHADDVLVYDNTPDGKGHRLVARFIAGELTTHTSPEWLRSLFGRELDA